MVLMPSDPGPGVKRALLLAAALTIFLIAIGTAAFRLTANLADVDLGHAPLIFLIGCGFVALLIGFFVLVQRRGHRDGN